MVAATWPSSCKSIDVPDAQTAVMKLKKPTPRLHYNFIAAIAGAFDILPEHVWKGAGPDEVQGEPADPHRPVQAEEDDPEPEDVRLGEEPGLLGQGQARPGSAVRRLPEHGQAGWTPRRWPSSAAEFDVGSIDEQHAKQLRNTGYPAMVTTQFHDPNPRIVWPNCDPARGVIAEPKMRQAINYLIDREKIGNSIWPVKVPPAIYPWADYPSNEQWKNDELAEKYKFEYSLDKANALLDEIAPKNAAGKRTYKGKEINLEFITASPVDGAEYAIANVIKTDLAKAGVPATLRSLSGPRARARSSSAASTTWTPTGTASRFDPQQLYTDLDQRQGPADRQERGRQEQAAAEEPGAGRAVDEARRTWTRRAPRRSRCWTRRWRSTSSSCR